MDSSSLRDYEVPYRSQVNDVNPFQKIPGIVQCFPNAAWMLLNYYVKVSYEDYLDDVESSVGIPGDAEIVIQTDHLDADHIRSGTYWRVHQAALVHFLGPDYSVKLNLCAGREDIIQALRYGPVIIGTSNLPFSKGKLGGHIVTGVGITVGGILINDPLGDYHTDYSSSKGRKIIMSYSDLNTYTQCDIGRARILFARR